MSIQFGNARTLNFTRAIVIVFAFLCAGSAGAQQATQPSNQQARQTIERIFAIYGVKVDKVAQNAFAARNAAIAEAEQRAFRALLEKIVPSDDIGLIGDVSEERINEMLQSYEIVEERSSSRRYIAELNMQFSPSKVREFLGLKGIRYSEIGGGPVLLLPIFETAGVLTLFEEGNKLRLALQAMDLDNYLIKFVIPEGNFKDRALLSPNWIVHEGANDALLNYASERNISQVSILLAKFINDGQAVRLQLNRITEQSPLEVVEIARRAAENDEEVLRRASEISLGRQNLAWKSQTLTRFGEFSTVSAVLHVQTIEDWVEIRTRINRTPVVRDFVVQKLSIPLSHISLRYLGVPEQLVLSLKQVGVTLRRIGDQWEIGLGESETPDTDTRVNQMK